MGPSPTYHSPEGEECETSVKHGLPLWAEPAVGYCSRQPRPSPIRGSRFIGAHAVGPSVGEQKPLGKTPLRGNASPGMTPIRGAMAGTRQFPNGTAANTGNPHGRRANSNSATCATTPRAA